MNSVKGINARIIQSLYLPGDDDQTRELKKTFYIFSTNGIIPIAILTFICYLWDLPVLMQYGLLLLLYYLINFPYFLYSKKLYIRYFYIGQIYTLVITLLTIARLGGILYSAGLIYTCLTVALFTFTFPDKKLAIIASVISFTGIIALAVGQPWLKPAPEMLHPYKNLVFTTINAAWQTVYILMTVLNVFERRNREEYFKNQKLQELNNLRTKLYTNISHEFRTPLTIISGAATMDGNAGNQQLPYEGKGGRIELIRNNASRLLRLVNQMLNLSKLESGILPVLKVQTDIIPFVSYLIESLRSYAAQKDIVLHFDKGSDQFVMDADIEKMEDIILNLLHNAIKFTPPGGEVNVSISEGKNGHLAKTINIKIIDKGIGISDDKVDRIFERFYQVDENSPEGSGIGLALVKEYVDLLDGEISVQSAVGQGTTFSIILPVTNQHVLVSFEEIIKNSMQHFRPSDLGRTDLKMLKSNNDDDNQPLILIVEDNHELSYYLKSILVSYFRVEIAFDGKEGVDKAKDMIPDLIISDVMMPVMDGFELCDELKNDFKTNHIPIILLTAKIDAESKLAGLKKGADDYISKPFNTEELLVRIKNLIDLREKLKQKYSEVQSGELIENEVYTGLDKLFMDELQTILELHFMDEHFGIEEACSAMKISRVQLHRKLIALTGLSASHFLNHFRLDKAANLLHSSRKTVAEIAYEAGFSDPNYFSKIFKKRYGKSAQDFRAGS